jgi:hypothetical protein
MKFVSGIFAITISAILFSAVSYAQSESSFTKGNPKTDWLKDAKVGAFMHFLPTANNFATVESAFDVEGLADQLEKSGVSYFIFTLGQNSGWFNAPNPVYERLAGYNKGERCSQRDIPMELAKALKKRGIRLMLYLPCQAPTKDLKAVKGIGFPETPLGDNRHFTEKGAKRWAKVIRYWSVHYGDNVSGWWFDGGYKFCGFSQEIATQYSKAAKKGNHDSIVTFNPGISFKRSTFAEDYTAGELRNPFEVKITGRWIDGSQAHILTFLGKDWGSQDLRYSNEVWVEWVKQVTSKDCAVTFDIGPNYDSAKGSIGLVNDIQIAQLRIIVDAVR